MNGEWISTIALALIPALVTAVVGYFLGTRSQRKQDLREYITEIVKDEYPALFQEMKKNSETLDNYLESPNESSFDFPELTQIYDRGLDGFMKKHHNDLHLLVDSFRRNILPKFYGLRVGDLMDKLYDISLNHLRKSLPKTVADASERIAHDLSKSINPNYVIPDLLNERDEEVRNKIERCIMEKTSPIRQKAKRSFVIKGQTTAINYGEISQSLLKRMKPETKKLVNAYKKLKVQTDKEVKDKLLPLLRRYISNPI